MQTNDAGFMLKNVHAIDAHLKSIAGDREYRTKLVAEGLLSSETLSTAIQDSLLAAQQHLEAAYKLVLIIGLLKTDEFFQSKSQLSAVAGVNIGPRIPLPSALERSD